MAKLRTRFVCQECGAASVKWQGRCPDCGRWNSMVEEAEKAPARRGSLSPESSVGGRVVRLHEVETRNEERVGTGIGELDRVTGGGLVRGSLILVGGPPGIGKSTLLLHVADALGRQGKRVLYVSGEESPAQVRMRAERLGVQTRELLLLPETDLGQIMARVQEEKPALVMVDSIQTMSSGEVESAPGSVSQVRECTAAFMRLAKSEGVMVILVGHVTKDGSIAGPRVMEHLVDTVLYFEGDDFQNHRILKAVKNRFGSTSEIGLFEMQSGGLVEVPDASGFFLSHREGGIPGSCIVPVLEGTRAICVEIQSLCKKVGFGNPMRRASGLDPNRLVMLLAVLEKRGGLSALAQNDVFVNVAGGMDVDEPGTDLGVLLAVASSMADRPVLAGTAVLGEVGLGGEVRGVSHAPQRVVECGRMGVSRVIIPAVNAPHVKVSGVEVRGVRNLCEALAILGEGGRKGAGIPGNAHAED